MKDLIKITKLVLLFQGRKDISKLDFSLDDNDVIVKNKNGNRIFVFIKIDGGYDKFVLRKDWGSHNLAEFKISEFESILQERN